MANLCRDKRESHEPALLLAILDFLDSRDDKPNNGLALCPNHHRAMDRFLIAPCPDARHRAGVWRVGPALDARIEGPQALVALAGQRVIAPAEEKFYPAAQSLRWREERLTHHTTGSLSIGIFHRPGGRLAWGAGRG